MLDRDQAMEQLNAIAMLAKAAQESNALVVSEIGSQTTWLHETGDHESYLYLSGPMGMAPSVALGVALANPDRPVLGICGDGALAMNFSALVTIAHMAPKNLTLAVMDNAVYDFTGKIASPSAAIDWEKMIAGLPAFKSFQSLKEGAELSFDADQGLGFIQAIVKPASRKAIKFPYRPFEIHRRFLRYVSNSE